MKNQNIIIIQDENVEEKVIDETIDHILEEYKKFDLCIAELLESLELRGFSIPQVVTIYAKVMKKIENDSLYMYKEGEMIEIN